MERRGWTGGGVEKRWRRGAPFPESRGGGEGRERRGVAVTRVRVKIYLYYKIKNNCKLFSSKSDPPYLSCRTHLSGLRKVGGGGDP